MEELAVDLAAERVPVCERHLRAVVGGACPSPVDGDDVMTVPARDNAILHYRLRFLFFRNRFTSSRIPAAANSRSCSGRIS